MHFNLNRYSLMIRLWSLRKWDHKKKNLGFSLRSSCQISVAMTLTSRVNPIQCFGHVNVTFVREPVPESSWERGGHAGKAKRKGWVGGTWKSVTCWCPFVSHVRHSGAAGSVCVWVKGGGAIFPNMRKKKKQDLYFLQPDIKKIAKHKSIKG